METLPYLDKIAFSNINRRPRINQEEVGKWLNNICEKENHTIISLSYNFCSDEHLLEINREYLNHDYLTDIITFDLSDNKREIESDIYISTDRVKENALNLKVSFETELLRVMVHGLLHLMGYNDKTKKQKEIMRNKEDACLFLFKPRST